MTIDEARQAILDLSYQFGIPEQVIRDDQAMRGFDGCECQALNWQQAGQYWFRHRASCGTGQYYVDQVVFEGTEYSLADLRSALMNGKTSNAEVTKFRQILAAADAA